MTAQLNNSIHGRLINEINNRSNSGLPIEESEIFWLNRLKLDAKKIMLADPALAHIALAAIAHLEWDEELAFHHLNCATSLTSDIFIKSQYIVGLVNFGFFSDALQMAGDILSPENGMFTEYYKLFITIGAFQKLDNFQKKAVLLGVDLAGFPTEITSKASDILKFASIPNERASEALSVAGSMLRDRKMSACGEAELSVDDEYGHSPIVFVTFKIRVEPKVAADMTWDLYEKLLSKFPDYSPSLNIGFRSVVPL